MRALAALVLVAGCHSAKPLPGGLVPLAVSDLERDFAASTAPHKVLALFSPT